MEHYEASKEYTFPFSYFTRLMFIHTYFYHHFHEKYILVQKKRKIIIIAIKLALTQIQMVLFSRSYEKHLLFSINKASSKVRKEEAPKRARNPYILELRAFWYT